MVCLRNNMVLKITTNELWGRLKIVGYASEAQSFILVVLRDLWWITGQQIKYKPKKCSGDSGRA